MTRYYTKLQGYKLTPDSLLSRPTAAGIFFIISSRSEDILKIALLIIITSHNSHIVRSMLITFALQQFFMSIRPIQVEETLYVGQTDPGS